MPTIRPLAWPSDREALLALDTSFVVDRRVRLERGELVEEVVSPGYRKAYDLAGDLERVAGLPVVLVADDGAALAALRWEAWNRRAVLEYLLVAPSHRRQRLGAALLEAAEARALTLGARCLWIETQDVNAGAVRFYQRCGYRWCGFDDSLYDPALGETALFFVKDLVR